MDRQRNHHLPGTLLGRLRHRAEGRIRRWRKLPPEAGVVAITDSNPGANSVGDAVDNTLAGAVADGNAKCDTDSDSDSGTNTYTIAGTFGDADAQRDGNADSVGNSDTSSHTVAEGVAFGDGAGCLPDPHKGSGGRDTPQPAAAQAAGRGIGPHGHRRRPAD